MSSFKFNFSNTYDDNSEVQPNVESVQLLDSEEVKPENQFENLDNIVQHAKIFTYGDLKICHVIASEVIHNMNLQLLKSEIQLADSGHSDLVTGKYEGGLKIWECTADLIQYLTDNIDTKEWSSTSILDLGCGAGLLGILTLIHEAEFVLFQDYNKEILQNVTIPNVLLNHEDDNQQIDINKCKFYSGDWESFNKLLPKNITFDYILTSETIYNPNNYIKILDILNDRLKQNGTAYIAAKTHYFGVGGGTRQFEQCLNESGNLDFKICWKSDGGIQREIIKLKKK